MLRTWLRVFKQIKIVPWTVVHLLHFSLQNSIGGITVINQSKNKQDGFSVPAVSLEFVDVISASGGSFEKTVTCR